MNLGHTYTLSWMLGCFSQLDAPTPLLGSGEGYFGCFFRFLQLRNLTSLHLMKFTYLFLLRLVPRALPLTTILGNRRPPSSTNWVITDDCFSFLFSSSGDFSLPFRFRDLHFLLFGYLYCYLSVIFTVWRGACTLCASFFLLRLLLLLVLLLLEEEL